MRTPLIKILLLAVAAMLASCASEPKYAKNRLAGQACIDDDASYANQGFSPTQGSLGILAVDGFATGSSSMPVCLAPGKHKFRVHVQTDFRKIDGDIELDLKENSSYWLRAKLQGSFGFGSAFDFQLIDITDNKRNVVTEVSLPAEAQTFNFMYVPGSTVPLLILPK